MDLNLIYHRQVKPRDLNVSYAGVSQTTGLNENDLNVMWGSYYLEVLL